MKLAVMGAGAVGCYYGGMMARAGHEVVLVGRPAHVEAVRRDGLLMETQSFREHVRMAADSDPAAVRGAELVLFCVKSGDTESAGAQIAPHLAPGARVWSLQNGVDNAERLQAVLPQQRVFAAVVYVATAMGGPGHLRHFGRGELVMEAAAAAGGLDAAFAAAGVPVQISDGVAGALWAKLIVNCAYNALSAITQLPYGRIVAGEGAVDVMRDAVDECLAVAHAAGITIPGDVHAATLAIARAMPGQLSSTAQDLARGKPSEIDHLNGYVVQRGRALGVPTPVNRTLHAIVKLVESARQT